ncbi:MAG: response regulator [Anaerolineales bacterium]|nr:response regulator [Anaerolineales bacterium]
MNDLYSRKHQILIIDDEIILANNMKNQLQRFGYEVLVGPTSGKDAIPFTINLKPDLVIMDIFLNGEPDGIEVSKKINTVLDIPIIYSTAFADEDTINRASISAPYGYLIKPIDLNELHSSIEIALYKHKMEKILKESEQRYRLISELTSDFAYAYRIDPDGNCIREWVTDAFQRITGFLPDQIDPCIGWLSLVHPDDTSIVTQRQIRLTEGYSDVSEYRILHKDGQYRWLRDYSRPMKDSPNQSVTHIIGAAQDITLSKYMESQLQISQKRLIQNSRLAAIGELASGFAHHINNPLTSILAEAQLMLHSLPVDHPCRESADAIQKASWRVFNDIQKLIELSKPITITLEKTSINNTLETATSLITDHLSIKQVDVKQIFSYANPCILANEYQLWDLWINLLLLTLDANPKHIEIKTSISPDNLAVVDIWDDGKYISPAEIEALLDADFITLPGERGIGIEMRIYQEIIRQYGGEISIVSDEKDGTTQSITFPLIAEVQNQQAEIRTFD